MKRDRGALRSLILAGLALGVTSATASAQWTRIGDVPAANIFTVWTRGDTIAAGSDSTAFVSVDAGATWLTTSKVASGVTMIQAVTVHDGRLYAGTFGQGVFVSSDLGTTWQSFNQGLVGGFADSQLTIMDLLLRGDTLFAATGGAGPWMRSLVTGGGWTHYGSALEPAQAGNMESIAGSPARLLALAGFNGDVFFRDRADAEWTESLLFNDRLAAGLAPLAAVWTGQSWLVGTNIGVFHSALGRSPWTYFDFGLRPTLFASFALRDGVVFTHFANGAGTGIEFSADDGATWQVLDSLPLTFTYKIATLGSTLYAGRVDGLWRRSTDSVAVPPAVAGPLRLAIAGPNPVHDAVRLGFTLPEPAHVRIDVFDVSGRRARDGIDGEFTAGPHEVAWPSGDLAPGVYLAYLQAGKRSASVRLVRTR